MHLSTVTTIFAFVLPCLAGPVALAAMDDGIDALAKRCCILCDGPTRCGSNDKREAFDTLEELHTRSQESTEGIAKRCCILCDGPARCGSNDKREAVETFAEITGLKL